MPLTKPILIAEDDPNDQFLLKEAFRRAGVNHPVIVVENGEEAIRYMANGHTGPGRHPAPCLLLTDLKMPRIDGFELLAWVRQQERLQDMPIIVMSASGHKSDLDRTLSMGARDFFVKPGDFRSLVHLVKNIDSAWIIPHCSAPASA